MNDQYPAPTFDLGHHATGFLARCGWAWDRFFFSPADPTTLGMVRICCGLIVAYTLIVFTLDLQDYFGKDAWVDLPTRNAKREKELVPPIAWGWAPSDEKPQEGTPEWSIWFHVTDPTAMTVVHYGFILAAVFLALGFCTRITAAITWFAMLSYINRSQTTVFGVDTMTSITLLYLMIGPSGAALSVDRLIQRYWTTWRALRRGQAESDEGKGGVREVPLAVVPSVGANLAIRLLQVHLCIIYMAAGLAKLQGAYWWQGSAVWGTIANFELAPMQHEWYMAFLKFLAHNRFWWELFMTTSTIFTLAFEIGFTFLVWPRRTRWVILCMAIALHGGIGLFMGLKTFSMMMLTMCLAFVAPETIHRLLRRVARAPGGLKLAFEASVGRSLRTASATHALDIWGQVDLVERAAPADASPKADMLTELVTPGGERLTGAAMWLRLLVTLGIFRVFAPWCWINVFRKVPEMPAPLAAAPSATLPPTVTLRPAGEPTKTAVTRGRSRR